MKYRVKPSYHIHQGEATPVYKVQVKKWYGWVTIQECTEVMEADEIVCFLNGDNERIYKLEQEVSKWMQQACYWEQKCEIIAEENKRCDNCNNSTTEEEETKCIIFGGGVKSDGHCELHRYAPRCVDCMNFTPTSSMVGVCRHFGEEVTPSSSCENIRLK